MFYEEGESDLFRRIPTFITSRISNVDNSKSAKFSHRQIILKKNAMILSSTLIDSPLF